MSIISIVHYCVFNNFSPHLLRIWHAMNIFYVGECLLSEIFT